MTGARRSPREAREAEAIAAAERTADRAEPEASPTADAVNSYRARFGGTLCMWDIPPDRLEAWLAAIRDAVRAGRTLTDADLERVTGLRPPPPGAKA